MHVLKLVLFTLILFGLSACDREAASGKGFSLPAGDIANGSVVFDDLQCAACHTVHGRNNKVLQRSINVRLGGPDKTYTYEFLVTSIINPSHKLADGYDSDEVSHDGESKMRKYNDFLTVTELVDLVEYLKNTLHVSRPPKTLYPELFFPIMRDPDGEPDY